MTFLDTITNIGEDLSDDPRIARVDMTELFLVENDFTDQAFVQSNFCLEDLGNFRS